MWRRLAQILSLLACMMGWAVVGCTLAMHRWRVAQLGGQGGSSVVVTAWYWSDLWKDCYEDSTAVVNCVDFGVLWRVKPHIQTARGLLVAGLCLGLVGTGLTFFGLECTRVGGGQRCKDGLLAKASFIHLLGGLSDGVAYGLYINRVVGAFVHSKADPSTMRYEMGPPLYLGLVGALLVCLGGTVNWVTACRPGHPSRDQTIRGKEEEEEVRGCDLRNTFGYKMTSVVTV